MDLPEHGREVRRLAYVRRRDLLGPRHRTRRGLGRELGMVHRGAEAHGVSQRSDVQRHPFLRRRRAPDGLARESRMGRAALLGNGGRIPRPRDCRGAWGADPGAASLPADARRPRQGAGERQDRAEQCGEGGAGAANDCGPATVRARFPDRDERRPDRARAERQRPGHSAMSRIHIDTREHLIGWLGEAAEIEHNLMCCYLYGLFSLKRSSDAGLSAEEGAFVDTARGVLRGIALEEMTHLALVANLTSSLGAVPNFTRPNFPGNRLGLAPAAILIDLAPFNLATLEHFVYLERPVSADVADGSGFSAARSYARVSVANRLMPVAGDYSTVGELYEAVRGAFRTLSETLGEKALFCGDPALQIGALDVQLPGLAAVRDLESALRAIDVIVIQGEGSVDDPNSHFERFCQLRREYVRLLEKNPGFRPGRDAARNPVMRKPPVPEGKVWIQAQPAADYLDLVNALYMLMVRTLIQPSVPPQAAPARRRALVATSIRLMQIFAPLAEKLTTLPARDDSPGTAGMSFATIRNTSVLTSPQAESRLLLERLKAIRETAAQLAQGDPDLRRTASDLDAVIGTLTERPEVHASPPPMQQSVVLAPLASEWEEIPGKAVSIRFNAKRCIHSRACVTTLPNVFLANTPGRWIFPDAADAAALVAVAHRCPSGAIQYVRHDGQPNEAAPAVNLITIRENGPLALHAELRVAGVLGLRATLCRCGQSKGKPYCDGSHVEAKFTATGEPLTLDTPTLER